MTAEPALLAAIAALAAPAASPDPLSQLPGTGYGEALLRMVVALVVLVGVLLVAARVLPRWLSRTPAAGSGHIRIIESTRLEPRRSLHLVEVGSSRVLIGSSEHGLTVLDRVGPASQGAIPPADPPAPVRDFASLLRAEPRPAPPTPQQPA